MLITYSKNIFIPVTDACINSCAYCGFKSNKPKIMSMRTINSLILTAKKMGCKEALFTYGENPESNTFIRKQLKKWGFSSSLEYLYYLCRLSLKHGILPHSNPGVLNLEELKTIKELNASLGLMLENSSTRFHLEGMPHYNCPSKKPKVRLRTLQNAGKLKIPYTTGLLIGIGETMGEIEDSLNEIAKVHSKYNNIQEIIIQNFRPKKETSMEKFPTPTTYKMIYTLKMARNLFPKVGIQIPPNLNPYTWSIYPLFGMDDLGGISPVTTDYINPMDNWPDIPNLKQILTNLNFQLRERLPIYPKFINKGWYSNELEELILNYVNKDGLVK